MTFDEFCDAWLKPAVSCWWWDQSRELDTQFYLWYKPANKEIPGAMIIDRNAPNDEWILASPERIPVDLGTNSVLKKLKDIARRLPILPTE